VLFEGFFGIENFAIKSQNRMTETWMEVSQTSCYTIKYI